VLFLHSEGLPKKCRSTPFTNPLLSSHSTNRTDAVDDLVVVRNLSPPGQALIVNSPPFVNEQPHFLESLPNPVSWSRVSVHALFQHGVCVWLHIMIYITCCQPKLLCCWLRHALPLQRVASNCCELFKQTACSCCVTAGWNC